MRISRGCDLYHIVLKASNVHNCTYHRSLNTTPVEIIFGTKKFTLSKPAWLQEKHSDLKTLETKLQHTNLKKQNQPRIDTDWTNKRVLMKVSNRGKLDPVWEGPYDVISVNSDLGTVQIDKGRSLEWVSVRKLKPLGERDTVVNTTFPISKR